MTEQEFQDKRREIVQEHTDGFMVTEILEELDALDKEYAASQQVLKSAPVLPAYVINVLRSTKTWSRVANAWQDFDMASWDEYTGGDVDADTERAMFLTAFGDFIEELAGRSNDDPAWMKSHNSTQEDHS